MYFRQSFGTYKTLSCMRYIKEFDSLRAFAVISVMFAHYLGQYKILSYFGTSGVTLFFVLSGFLITQILIAEKEKFSISYPHNMSKMGNVLKVFYVRRSLRIFPIYYILLAVLFILNVDSARGYWEFHVLYLSNFFYSFYHPFDHLAHFWSLAVEEQFYLIWPLMILFLPVKVNRISFFCILILLSILFKIWMLCLYPGSDAYYFLMPACIEAFAAGALVVELMNKKISAQLLTSYMALSLFMFVCLQILPIIHPSAVLTFIGKILTRTAFSAFSVTLLLMILQGVNMGFVRRLLTYKPLIFLGKISYGIYIYHHFVPSLQRYLQDRWHLNLSGSGFNLLLHFLISFGIAYVSFVVIESPINKLKKRFAY